MALRLQGKCKDEIGLVHKSFLILISPLFVSPRME